MSGIDYLDYSVGVNNDALTWFINGYILHMARVGTHFHTLHFVWDFSIFSLQRNLISFPSKAL